eukprot:TRINITY_DN1626_c0_g1_i1.p1 TRINITY_DN1626_c0_g1~~TRINITY_DN1626_c0_g1_i1.p1  ORF type:complete len:334 (+),score=104.49 TRINITY_DN1626_c0_g1_i1:48-1049(+)
MVKSPPPLALPGCGVAREPADEDELAAACDMLEDVVTLNKDYTAPFKTRDMRMIFVSGTRDPVEKVGLFAEDVLSLCPKSWPCALWMCDRVGRTCGLPFTQYSARRLLSAAVFLLLSTEDDAVVELAKKARRSLQKLEYLGWGLLQLLREQPHLDNTDAGRMVGPDPRAWEEIVGMDRLGMVRGCLPMVAKSVRGGGERAAAGFVHVLSGMGRSEAKDAWCYESPLQMCGETTVSFTTPCNVAKTETPALPKRSFMKRMFTKATSGSFAVSSASASFSTTTSPSFRASPSSTTFGSSLLLTSPYERAPRGALNMSLCGVTLAESLTELSQHEI